MAFVPHAHYLCAVPQTKLPLGVVLGLPAVVFLALAWKLNFLCDDAFISFRYTRNWIEGHGLRYNLDAQPPVEGYSNFLWVLLMGPFAAAGIDLGVVARVLSALCGLLLCVWVTDHARRRFELNSTGALATGLFFATLPCTALWATGGLATMPSALLVFGVYERLLGDPHRPRGIAAGLFAAGAVLMRADGFVWITMLLAGGGLHWLWSGRERRLLRAALQTLGIAALVTAAHFLWRHSYYGEWLPNTARVKAGFSTFRLERGWNYLAQWWLTIPSIAVVLVLSMWRVRAAWRSALAVSLTVVMGAQAYALWIGGDFMPFGRLMFAAVPFLALMFAALMARWQESSGKLAAVFAVVLLTGNTLACFDINPLPSSVRSRFHFRLSSPWQSEIAMRAAMVQRAQEWILLGRAMALFTEPSDSIVLSGIGAVGYHSRVRVFDRYGLVSPEVLASSKPLKQASPGHDRAVSQSFFFPQHPTLGGTFLAPANAPLSHNMPPGWAQHPFSKIMRMERHLLPVDQGFPADTELRVLVHTAWPQITKQRTQSP